VSGGWGSALVGGGVAADRERVDDLGELRERVVEELPVNIDHLEAEPCGRAVGEEATERAVSIF
jgi:hypothetical protein